VGNTVGVPPKGFFGRDVGLKKILPRWEGGQIIEGRYGSYYEQTIGGSIGDSVEEGILERRGREVGGEKNLPK